MQLHAQRKSDPKSIDRNGILWDFQHLWNKTLYLHIDSGDKKKIVAVKSNRFYIVANPFDGQGKVVEKNVKTFSETRGILFKTLRTSWPRSCCCLIAAFDVDCLPF
jgi:hypothetical protein